MRISDWSSDVCSSDLPVGILGLDLDHLHLIAGEQQQLRVLHRHDDIGLVEIIDADLENSRHAVADFARNRAERRRERSEEHTYELQSLMRISYAVFCLKKTNKQRTQTVRITPMHL